MFEQIMKHMDLRVAMPIGAITILLSLCGLADEYLVWFIFVSAALAFLYISYALFLWLQRPKFDWHLIHGHFLRKLVCLILLVPFLVMLIPIMGGFSSKEMVYEANLYQCQDSDLPCTIRSKQESPNLFWSTYFHFIDPGNQHMTTTKNGRLYAALVAILGLVLLNGFLISSIVGWIEKRKEEWLNGKIRYKRRELGKYRFAVVIGANEIVASVIHNLFTSKKDGEINYKCEGNNRYVILQTSRNVDEVRAELASYLNDAELKKVVIYKALRDSIVEIEKLFTDFATEIYVLGESTQIDGGETYHDAMNMRCVNMIAEALNQTREKRIREKIKNCRSVRKVCKVMFEYQTTSSIFQFSDISMKIKDNMVFIPFNRYESWARKVIVDGSYGNIDYLPLDGNGISKDSSEFVHIVIVGMSKMGIAMGIETLLQAHYLNSDKARTRITFIDTNADQEMSFFKGRYANMFELIRSRFIDATLDEKKIKYDCEWNDPIAGESGKWKHLCEKDESFLDVEIEFIKGEIESDGVRYCLRQLASDKKAKLTIAICLPNTHQAVAASLYMPIEIYKNERLQQIWVYQRESEDIISNLNKESIDLRYKKIRPFGMLYGEYMSDRTLYLKALLVNVAYDITNKYNGADWPKDILDKSDKGYTHARQSWKRLSVDKKWSNKYFADSIYVKIRNVLLNDKCYSTGSKVQFFLYEDIERTIHTIEKAITDNIDSLAVCEHNRWNIQQLILGYSPCDEELDSIFKEINENKETDQLIKRYLNWKETNLHNNVCSKKIKDDVKESALRIHPNICSYNHLSSVDSGAKQYDEDLNMAICKIIAIVDGCKPIKNK